MHRKGPWPGTLAACPLSMKIAIVLLFGYGMFSFIIFDVRDHALGVPSVGPGNTPPYVFQGVSAVWMFFYFLEMAIFYSRISVRKEKQRCKQTDSNRSQRQNRDQSDGWDLYKGLGPGQKDYQDWVAELTAGRISTAEFKRRTEKQREYLLELIDNLLARRISFKEFAESYCPFVLDLVRDFMSEHDEEFFETVREKLEWVNRNSSARREDNMVITPEEFIEWLREQRARHFNVGGEHSTPNPRT